MRRHRPTTKTSEDAAGFEAGPSSPIRHFDGATWTAVALPTNVFIVGDNGTILH